MESPKKELIIGEYSCPEFEYLSGNDWDFTEKIDGTNVRVLWDGEDFRFGGRTDASQMPIALLDELKFIFRKEVFRDVFTQGTRVIVYGEGYGGNIQRGSRYSKQPRFVVFDILIGNFWIGRQLIKEFCEKLGLDVVPNLGCGTLFNALYLVNNEKIKSAWGDFQAEGIVARPRLGLKSRNGKRIITKIKGKDFKGGG